MFPIVIAMNNTFWIGVYPGIDDSMIDYLYFIIEEFIKKIGR